MPNGREQNQQMLIECLVLIESELRIIVFQRKELFRKEYLKYLPGPWDEVERHFEGARRQIESNNFNWEYVAGVGLVGNNLAWKRDILREAKKGGIIGRFLKLANTFLSSLSGAVPGVEFIKEYKEFVEGCLKVIPSLR